MSRRVQPLSDFLLEQWLRSWIHSSLRLALLPQVRCPASRSTGSRVIETQPAASAVGVVAGAGAATMAIARRVDQQTMAAKRRMGKRPPVSDDRMQSAPNCPPALARPTTANRRKIDDARVAEGRQRHAQDLAGDSPADCNPLATRAGPRLRRALCPAATLGADHGSAPGAPAGRRAPMPARTEKQRRFMGAELQRKREGKKTQTDMTENELEKMASKPDSKRKSD